MEQQSLQKAIHSGLKKMRMMENELGEYLLRSIMAGLYLGVIVFLYWSLSHNLSSSPFGKVVASLFFGVGLFVIIFTNSELFTSNNMYLTVTSLAQKTSWKQTARLWAICYLGNLLGSILIALLLAGAGSLAALPIDHALYVGALHKIQMSSSEIFFKGILANWIVCLAVWVSFQVKEDIAKLMVIILIVFVFLYLGGEHSIANLATFSMALLGRGEIDLLGVAHNLLWSTTGNIVGGGFVVGFNCWYLNQKTQAKADVSSIGDVTSSVIETSVSEASKVADPV